MKIFCLEELQNILIKYLIRFCVAFVKAFALNMHL